MIKAILFDLDGVITDTAILHYEAWKKAANSIGCDLTWEFNKQLKGVDREESLSRILNYNDKELSNENFNEILKFKNNLYVESLKKIDESYVMPNIKNFMSEIKENKMKIIIASASKNAPLIIEQLNLNNFVDCIVNPLHVKNGKPYPDIFLLAASLAKVENHECIGIEDSQAGIDALNSANIKSIAVVDDLEGATVKMKSTKELSIELINKMND